MLLQHTCTVCTRALVSTHRLACILRPSTCEWIAASAAVHLCCRQLTYKFVGVLTCGRDTLAFTSHAAVTTCTKGRSWHATDPYNPQSLMHWLSSYMHCLNSQPHRQRSMKVQSAPEHFENTLSPAKDRCLELLQLQELVAHIRNESSHLRSQDKDGK